MVIPKDLRKIGIENMWQLPMIMPVQYTDTNNVVSDFFFLNDFALEERVICCGTVSAISQIKYLNKAPYISIRVVDKSGLSLQTNFFGTGAILASFLEKYKLGHAIYLCGKPVLHRGQWVLNSAKIVDIEELYKINVRYLLTYKNKTLPKSALDFISEHVLSSIPLTCEVVTKFLNRRHNRNQILNEFINIPVGLTFREIITEIHTPTDINLAMEYQGYVEKIAALLTAAKVKYTALKWGRERTPIIASTYAERSNQLNFSMTDEQFNCVVGLARLFESNRSQKAMLIGDVGTGKSCVLQVLAASFCDAGARVVFLAPSQNLANQLHSELLLFFPDLMPKLVVDGVKVDYLSAMSSKLWIGTTSLFFQNWPEPFDLVVVDEQQRYSVEQRELLCAGGGHLLEATATPIPRSACLLKHGVVHQFHLNKCFTKKELVSTIHNYDDRKSLFARTLSNLKLGNKLLIICALKSESTSDLMADVTSAEDAYASWVLFVDKYKHCLPQNVRVGMCHSGLSSDENSAVINRFKNGDITILISTTIVETGLTVSKLNQVIVLNPERLGLVQHHQIRGRLARFGGVGYYDLYCQKTLSEKSLSRLELICSSTNGLHLALEDIKQRGFGDLSSESQTNSKAQKGTVSSYMFGKSLSAESLDLAVKFF